MRCYGCGVEVPVASLEESLRREALAQFFPEEMQRLKLRLPESEEVFEHAGTRYLVECPTCLVPASRKVEEDVKKESKRARARKLLDALEVGQCVLGAELRKEVGLAGPNWQGFLEKLPAQFAVTKEDRRVHIQRVK